MSIVRVIALNKYLLPVLVPSLFLWFVLFLFLSVAKKKVRETNMSNCFFLSWKELFPIFKPPLPPILLIFEIASFLSHPSLLSHTSVIYSEFISFLKFMSFSGWKANEDNDTSSKLTDPSRQFYKIIPGHFLCWHKDLHVTSTFSIKAFFLSLCCCCCCCCCRRVCTTHSGQWDWRLNWRETFSSREDWKELTEVEWQTWERSRELVPDSWSVVRT